MTAPARSEAILRSHLREMPFHRVIMRSIEAQILSEIDFPRPILDIGCGDGHFGSVVFPGGADVGLDPGIGDLAEAAGRGVYRLLVGADSGAMPFPRAAFSSVVSNCVFEHIPDIDRTVAEIARVVKPGGTFACTVIGERFSEFLTDARAWRRLGLGAVHRAYLAWFNRKSVHFHFDSPATWRSRFERAGFDVVRLALLPLAARGPRIPLEPLRQPAPPRRRSARPAGGFPFPALTDNAFWVRRLRRHTEEQEPEAGSCIAFVCTRRADSSVK